MTAKDSAPLAVNASQKFTRGHDILLTGLIGSGMNYRDIFHLEMSLETESEALELAIWIRNRLDETGLFPAPEEVLRQAQAKELARHHPNGPKASAPASTAP